MFFSKTKLKLASFLTVSTLASSCAAQLAPQPAAALPPATELLPQGGGEFKSYGQGPQTSAAKIAPVTGENFSQALRLTTITPPKNYWDYGSTTPLIAPVKRGDVLWASVKLRRLTTLKESGEAQTEIAFMQQVDGREVRSLERLVSFGEGWTQFDIPFVAKADSAIGEAKIGVRYGYGKQSFELGGVRLLNYGQNVKVGDLPLTRIRYGGWNADAAWRKAADARIEKIRKGDLTVKVVDAAGKPVSGAKIEVRMKRHAFGWGTEIDAKLILDTTKPDNARYRQTLETYFNKVVFGNDLKWGRWIEPKTQERVAATLPWLRERKIAVRGHVMLWPSWQHLPSSLFTDDVKKDTAAIKKLVSDHIADQTNAMRGQLAEWDVANETFKHHDLLDILGRDAMVDWFKQARAGAPNVRLFYNDYTMFQPGEGQDYFFNTVKSLKDSGAPIGGIGEQGHFASSPPGIPSVLATLDKFGSLGLPIQITEFDIDTDDAGLQADFMRDFSIAVFSHPSVMGVMQWGFWEKAHWLPRAALWDKDWNLRPHGQVWTDLVFKTWWTTADGQTAKNGTYATRGFYGDYEITVSRGAAHKAVNFRLAPRQTALSVTMP